MATTQEISNEGQRPSMSRRARVAIAALASLVMLCAAITGALGLGTSSLATAQLGALWAQRPAERQAKAAGNPLLRAERVTLAHRDARVERVITVKRYAYFQLEGSPRGRWYVVLGDPPRTDQRVDVRGYARLRDFHSSGLDRHFEEVVFASARQSGTAR